MTIKVIEEQYRKLVTQYPDRPRIIAEGDSWFSPFVEDNLLRHVDQYADFHILNLAEAGDEASDIFSGAQLNRLAYALDEKTGFDFDVLMLSAGGNDLLGNLNSPGQDLLNSFPEDDPPQDADDAVARGVNKAGVKRAVSKVSKLYEEFFKLRRQISPSLDIWYHGYDVPFASGKEADLWDPIDWLPVGPWLDPALNKAGICDEGHQRAVLRYLVGELQKALRKLESKPDGVHFVDLAGALAWEGAWGDEIHPNRHGYQSVLARYKDRLDAVVEKSRTRRARS
jgi:lysophospholipase L1-like esterase